MTGLRLRRIRNPISWATSIASTAFRAAPNLHGITAAPMASLPTEAGRRTRAMTTHIPVGRQRALRTAGALVGLAVALGACTHTEEAVTASVPSDYRLRHPIAVQPADRSIVDCLSTARHTRSAP